MRKVNGNSLSLTIHRFNFHTVHAAYNLHSGFRIMSNALGYLYVAELSHDLYHSLSCCHELAFHS